ncbi:hypothetical protein N8600_10040 [Gammaproteobacteria bacterium]|nr:hypothetical protein [Gammaproteobacteria bacterium]
MNKNHLLIIPGVIIFILGATYFFANYRLKTVVDLRVEELIASGDYQEITYDSVAIQFNGEIALENLYVIDSNRNEYILENIHISEFDYFNQVPHHLHLSAQGLRFPAVAPTFGDSTDNLLNNYIATMMDQDLLPLSMNYRYDFDPEDSDRMDINADLSLPNSFFLSMEAQIKNVPMEGLDENAPDNASQPYGVSVLLQNADIPAASIALRDDGMVANISALQGSALGISGDEYRQQLLQQLQAAALFIPPQMQSLAQDLLSNFAEFMTGEKTLRVSITPQYNGNIQRLQLEVVAAFYTGDIGRIAELVQLNIETVE